MLSRGCEGRSLPSRNGWLVVTHSTITRRGASRHVLCRSDARASYTAHGAEGFDMPVETVVTPWTPSCVDRLQWRMRREYR